jgi:hypothetical protein
MQTGASTSPAGLPEWGIYSTSALLTMMGELHLIMRVLEEALSLV